MNIKFCVNHKGEVDFDFTCLLHTYFKVDDINNTTHTRNMLDSDESEMVTSFER